MKPHSSVALLLLLVIAPSARAALSLTSLAAHAENFDFLTASPDGSTTAWVNDQGTETTTGSPGWYWQSSASSSLVYETNSGSGITPRQFSFGLAGVNPVTDRAMGNFADATNPHTAWGLVMRNETGQTLTNVTVTYAGEQWRRNTSGDEKLTFSYLTSASDVTDLVPASGALPSGWTGVIELNFFPPQLGSPATGLEGNGAANRTVLTKTLAVTVPHLSFLALRWYDGDSSGNDMAMGIDDLTVVVGVPEPGALLLGGLACGVVGLVYGGRKLLATRRG